MEREREKDKLSKDNPSLDDFNTWLKKHSQIPPANTINTFRQPPPIPLAFSRYWRDSDVPCCETNLRFLLLLGCFSVWHRCCCLVVRRPLGIADMPLDFCLLTWCDMIKFGISGKSPHLTLVCWKGCFLEVHRLTRKEDHVDAPKPPGGALFWRNAGKHHLANYELKPETAIDGSWRRMAYAPLEYGYKVSKVSKTRLWEDFNNSKKRESYCAMFEERIHKTEACEDFKRLEVEDKCKIWNEKLLCIGC